jgi:predicted transposase/invertase (TIGR01784 family)
VSEATPEPYREWLRAIDDTLDEEVDESLYAQGIIQKLFESIRRDHLSPEERARMIEEYHQEELQQTKFEQGLEKGKEEGLKEGKKEEKELIAKNLLLKGITPGLVAEATGLSAAEIAALATDRNS